jgi:hypothetical protein
MSYTRDVIPQFDKKASIEYKQHPFDVEVINKICTVQHLSTLLCVKFTFLFVEKSIEIYAEFLEIEDYNGYLKVLKILIS